MGIFLHQKGGRWRILVGADENCFSPSSPGYMFAPMEK
jgi:hypothetical protein